MKKKMFKKLTAVIAAVTITAGMLVPVFAEGQSDYATREYVVSEFVQSVGRNNLSSSSYILSTFADSENIDDEYKSDITKAVTEGLLRGYEDKTLKPKENITRIEALAILSRCLDEKSSNDTETVTNVPVEFTDVPEWAKADIDKLSGKNIVFGYGDGRLGAEDNITVEQVKLLTDRTDEEFNTVDVGESFYGYSNNKLLRNAELSSTSIFDAKHGVVMESKEAWSSFGDIMKKINSDENEILEKLMSDELEYETGSAEQRVHDLLLCIKDAGEPKENDMALMKDLRNRIMGAESINELLNVSNEIFTETGVNPLLTVESAANPDTNIACPSISLSDIGSAGIISYREETEKAFETYYPQVMKAYMTACGIEVSDKDIENAVNVQGEMSKGVNYAKIIQKGLLIRQMYDSKFTAEMMSTELEKVFKEHPEINSETYDFNEGQSKAYSISDADKVLNNIKPSKILNDAGFNNYENIIFTNDSGIKEENKIFVETNLAALKINAIVKLGLTFSCPLNSEEEKVLDEFNNVYALVMTYAEGDKIPEYGKEEENGASTAADVLTGGAEDSILSTNNLTQLKQLLPHDIGLIYCDYYYSDEISEDVADMVNEIWDAYIARFKNNTWMEESTKENAIKKIENMIAVIGYPDNYNYPTIVPPAEGGTYFNNVVRVNIDKLNTTIRQCAEREFVREMMYMSPDTINACYIPEYNIINIFAGILNYPIYDKNASRAAKLGSIGVIIGHEIGHAFDNSGSQYDEVGRKINWWTENDSKEYGELIQHFVNYYKNFEVVDGVVQNSSITIGENMADFAGMQCVMDVIGDDKNAQKEALEAYARVWAQLGTEKYVTDSTFLLDVHSARNVRVDAVVASLDCFYELYDIKEGDAMYIAPEDRLRLW